MKLTKSITIFIAVLLAPVCFASAQTTPPIVNPDTGNIFVVILHDGDTLIPKLSEVVGTYGIKSGLILSDIGRLRNFTLGYYDISLRRYYKKTYTGPYDLATTQGTIAHSTNGSLNMDIVTLCDSTSASLRASNVTNRTVGGHLFGGIVSGMNIIIIKRLDTLSFVRDYHPENGTWDLNLVLVIPALGKDYANTSVKKRQDPRQSVNGRTALFGANSDAPVFDVAGRRINLLRNGRLEKAASGMYVTPQRTRKTGTIIKQ